MTTHKFGETRHSPSEVCRNNPFIIIHSFRTVPTSTFCGMADRVFAFGMALEHIGVLCLMKTDHMCVCVCHGSNTARVS